MKVYVVMDRVAEADMLVGVFTSRGLARKWINAHKDDPYSANPRAGNRYESLDIEETEFNPEI